MPEEKKEEQKNEDKKTEQCCCSCGGSKKKFAVITIAVILIAVLGVYASSWKKTKDEKISLGLSSPDFPYRDYTQEELDKMYPQIKNADVPTRVAPEETYAKFKEALKAEDVDAAVDCFVEEKRGEWKETFSQVKEEGNMKNLAGELSDELTKNYMYDTTASYSIPQKIDGEIFDHTISFTKDSNGDWKLDSL